MTSCTKCGGAKASYEFNAGLYDNKTKENLVVFGWYCDECVSPTIRNYANRLVKHLK